ncbi:N-acetylmuramoyl-L-alanine amidase family protein [Ihubacter sp. rT4E-8]|uniref:N-acetylmuramoyl-L-alanine amidase family protein n=1 Tax=Ihubacter sp. rT4E-8 TaxID=3242369 RepID=UPI003CE6E213
MPSVFLSPSTQEYNQFVNGGTEEYYANLIADAMVPYLRASGISFSRNNPGGTVTDSIASSNAGTYDFHLAIHSNAAPPNMSGAIQGPDVYYYRDSTAGQRDAEIIANNLKQIYPNPSLVTTVPTTTLAELRRTKAPAVLVEVAYHDNVEDANWIKNNVDSIGRNLALSVADILGVPFVEA